MFKKFLCLFAVLVLVAACDTTGTDADNANGKGLHVGGADPNTAPPTEEGLVKVGDRVFYEFNSSEITSEGRETLDHQAIFFKKNKSLKITVEGHCDERGTREYNIALGQRRAMAVKNYLVAEGVNAKRIKTISYGKERPAVTGHTEEDWAQNRRAVSVVIE